MLINDLTYLSVSLGVGAIIGLILRYGAPSLCVRFSKWSSDPNRAGLLLFGTAFFAAITVVNYMSGRYLLVGVGVALTLLELYGLYRIRQSQNLTQG